MGFALPAAYEPPVNWNTNPHDAILFDNGPYITGPTAGGACVGQQSLLQNTSLCLNVLGFTVSAAFNLADDFTLTANSSVDSVTVYAYASTIIVPPATINSGTMRIHAVVPTAPTSPAVATTSAFAVSIPGVFRQTETGANSTLCTRQVQAVKFTFTPAVNLAAGTYWLSWQLGTSAGTGPFAPPVTIVGQYGKPGANSMQSNPTFIPVTDTGIPACIPTPPNPPFPVPAPAQDFPFLVEGSGGGCYPDCNGDSTLTVADFGCFQTKFVAGDPYADCNGDSALTVADFGCFQTAFVGGC
jgi:hypothetical protein